MPGINPITSAAVINAAVGTNITAGVRVVGPSSSGIVSSARVAGRAGAALKPRKTRPADRSTAAEVSAEVRISTAITALYPSLTSSSSISDLATNVPKGGTAANESAPATKSSPV